MKEKEKYRKKKCELSKLKDYAPGKNNKAKKQNNQEKKKMAKDECDITTRKNEKRK